MADSFVKSSGSMLDERKKFVRGAKRIKKATAAKRATIAAKRAATRAKTLRAKAGLRKGAVAKKVPDKKSWLTQPVRIRKVEPMPLDRARQRAPILPTSKISVAPLKSVRVASTGGYVPGTEIPWEPVISSNVAAIAFDDENSILYIKFLDASIYMYWDFPAGEMTMFRVASSFGKFVWARVRDKYEYQRIQ